MPFGVASHWPRSKELPDPADLECAERLVCKDIDPQHSQILTWIVREGCQFLDHGRRGADAFGVLDRWKNGVVESAAHLELGLPRYYVHACLKGPGGAAVGDLDGDEHSHAEAHGEDVQARQKPMAAGVTQDMPAE